MNLITEILYDAQCAIFLFDITDNQSFKSIKRILEYARKINSLLTCILSPNKMDLLLSRQVTQDDIDSFIQNKEKIIYCPISCADSTGINQVIESIHNIISSNQDLIINQISVCSSRNKKAFNSEDIISTINLILIGDSKIGKTSFCNRFSYNSFHDHILTSLGIDSILSFIKIKGKLFQVILWDTVGQERYLSIPKMYYQNAHGVFLLFDVCSNKSFENIQKWFNNFKKEKSNGIENTVIYLIGNKIDNIKYRVISKEEGIKKAEEFGMKYFETSSKINVNILEVMARMIFECHSKIETVEEQFKVKLVNKKKKKSCCS